MKNKIKFNSIFISDVHLGSKSSQADKLIDFLNRTSSEAIYLVGDFIDGWQLNKKWYWPESHGKVLKKIIQLSEEGRKITYISGNHDDFLRKFGDLTIGKIKICSETIHKSIKKNKYLVIHGDQFDNVINHANWLALIGDYAYNLLLFLNRYFNKVSKIFGFEYFSLSAYLKRKVKLIVNLISNFEKKISNATSERKLNGVICGHIHHAEIRKIKDIDYLNCGDWVESCTALVENLNGEMELINWSCSKKIKALFDKIEIKSNIVKGQFAA